MMVNNNLKYIHRAVYGDPSTFYAMKLLCGAQEWGPGEKVGDAAG